MIDLNTLQENARKQRFYGETVIKWENGEPTMLDVHQKFKPKDAERAIFFTVTNFEVVRT